MSEVKGDRAAVLVLVSSVTAMLETIGELTGRDAEARGLIRVVRETFTER